MGATTIRDLPGFGVFVDFVDLDMRDLELVLTGGTLSPFSERFLFLVDSVTFLLTFAIFLVPFFLMFSISEFDNDFQNSNFLPVT